MTTALALPGPIWGFLGLMAGGWKLALVAAGLFALFGRRLGPFASRWLSPTPRYSESARAATPDAPPSRFGDRVYLLLVVMAATAVATWIIARVAIVYGPRPPR